MRGQRDLEQLQQQLEHLEEDCKNIIRGHDSQSDAWPKGQKGKRGVGRAGLGGEDEMSSSTSSISGRQSDRLRSRPPANPSRQDHPLGQTQQLSTVRPELNDLGALAEAWGRCTSLSGHVTSSSSAPCSSPTADDRASWDSQPAASSPNKPRAAIFV